LLNLPAIQRFEMMAILYEIAQNAKRMDLQPPIEIITGASRKSCGYSG